MLSIAALWGFFIILIAGLIFGLTGFGFALVAVPLLLIFFPATTVVPVISILGNVSSAIMLWEARRWIDLKRIWPLVVTGVLGAPFGTYLLLFLDAQALKLFMGVVIVFSALALIKGLHWHIRNEKMAFVSVGLSSGLLAGSTGIGGPPVILFFSNQGDEKQRFRANLIVYFTILGLSTIVSQWLGGLVTQQVLTYAGGFTLALVAGTLVGIRLSRAVSEVTFRRITLALVLVTGLVAVISGVGLM
jgi:hypothetical protein